MRFFLPFPPSSNNYRVPVRGRLILSAKAREYYVAAAVALQQQGFRKWDGTPERVEVTIEIQAPDRRRRDIENFVKPAIDAVVKAGLIDDDSQIDDLRIIRGPQYAGGRVWVTVTEMACAS